MRLRSIVSELAGSSAAVAAATIVVIASRTVREMVVAREFGVSPEVDAFVVAMILPMSLVGLASSASTAALVPRYIDTLERKGDCEARLMLRALRAVVRRLDNWLVPVSVLLFPVVAYIFSGQLSPTLRLLAVVMSMILVPLPVLATRTYLWSGVMNVRKRFFVPGLTPVAAPLVTIVLIFVAGDRLGVIILAVGFLLGGVLELGVMAFVSRSIRPTKSESLSSSTGSRTALAEWRNVAFASMFMGTVATVDVLVASRLDPGSVSSINYANRVPTALAGLGTVVVGTALLPLVGRLLAQTGRQLTAQALHRLAMMVFLGSVALVTVPVLGSKALVDLLYVGGEFSTTDAALVSRLQALFLLHIPFLLAGIVGVRFINAIQANRILIYISSANAVLNLVGNVLLVRLWGIVGIPVATTVMYAVSTMCIWWYVWRQSKNFGQELVAQTGQNHSDGMK